MNLIDKQNDLIEFINLIKNSEFVTIDTEFVRSKTYYPKLCLLQIANDKHAAAIDTLSEFIDLNPIIDIFNDDKIVKVFHAARQDLEIIFNLNNKIPNNIFDTQIASMALGFGDSIGYENLVKMLLNKNINKTQRYSDWSKRPLTKNQIEYALSDVTHLRDIYIKITNLLIKKNRLSWIKEEMDNLVNIDNYKIDISDAWRKIKIRSRDIKFINIVKELAEWRENLARSMNIPKTHIIKDDQLLELAVTKPKNYSDLKESRLINDRIINNNMASYIIKIFDKLGNEKFETENIDKIHKEHKLFIIIEFLLKIIAKRESVTERLIATRSEINKFLDGDDNVTFLSGWRYDIFGKKAIELKKGNLIITVKSGEIIEINK